MKKLFALLVALVGSLGLLSSCRHKTETPTPTPETPEVTPTPTQPEVSEDLKKAQEFVRSIYQASEGNVTANMDRAAKVPVNGKEFTVSWAVTVKSGNAEAVSVVKAEDNSKYVVNITYNNTITEEVKFTLTATITSAENESVTLDFEYTIPKFQANTVNQMLTEKDDKKVYFLEGIVTAINNDNGKDSFVLSDATGSIFCYEKTLDIRLGQKIQITGNYSENAKYPQISKVSLVQVMSENNDVVAASGTPVVTTVAEINAAAKAEGVKAEDLTEAYKGKYLEITGYIVRNSQGYYNLAVAADQASCCNLYAAASLNSKQFAGAKVVVKGFARGVSVGNGITVQAQSIELAPGETLPTQPSEKFEEPALVTDKTLTDVINLDAADEMKYTYKVTGIVSKLGQKDEDTSAGDYGNLWVTDGTTPILVYGATATATAIAFDETVGLYTYKNPKDFATNDLTKNIEVGYVLEMIVIRTSYKDTKQLNVVVLSAKPAHTHEPSSDWKHDETHHWHACGSCEELLDKAAHTWNEGEVTTAPTESAAGVKTFTCTVCSQTKTEAIAPVGHTHAAATEWTKNETHHWHACATCEEPVQLDKAEHTWNEGEVTTAPTVEAEGVKTFTCTVCGSKAKTESIEKLPKPLPEGAVVPVVGTAYRLGLVQGNLENKVYYITGAMSTFYLATTETLADGGDVYLEETTNGYYMYVMVGTDKNYINIERALGTDDKMHDNVKLSTTASTVWTYSTKYNTVITVIEEDTLYLGTRSDKTYTTVGPVKANNNSPFACYFFAAPAPHTHAAATEWTKDETHHWHACTGCTELLDKAEHVWGEGVVTTQPTETEDGVRTFTCTCGATKTTAEPALGHTHTQTTKYGFNDTHHWFVCACEKDEAEAKFEVAEHVWGEGVITTQPSYTAAGEKTYTCVCGKTNTEEVPMLQEPTPVETTIADLLAIDVADEMKASFYLTATVKGLGQYGDSTTAGNYGNFIVTDGTKDILVYGATETASALVFNKSTGLYGFTNPQDFLTKDSTKEIKARDVLEMLVVRTSYKDKNTGAVKTKEVYAIILDVTPYEYTVEEKVEFDIAEVRVASRVTEDLVLPTIGAKYNSNISWASSNEAVISTTGVIDRPDAGQEDVTVTLTATFKLGEYTTTETYEVTVVAEVAEGEEPVGVTYTADLNTITKTNTSYVTSTTTSGWVATNCAVLQGGTSDSNPTFKMVGTTSDRAVCLNGKTSAVGSLTSPVLNNGITKLTFNYGLPFSDTKIGLKVEIIDEAGTVLATKTISNNSATKLTKYTEEWILDTAVQGNFKIVITNTSPSKNTGNKDRTAVFNISWVSYN